FSWISNDAEVCRKCNVTNPSLKLFFSIQASTSSVISYKPLPRVEILSSLNDWRNIPCPTMAPSTRSSSRPSFFPYLDCAETLRQWPCHNASAPIPPTAVFASNKTPRDCAARRRNSDSKSQPCEKPFPPPLACLFRSA